MKRMKFPKKNKTKKNPLKPICVIGIALALVISWSIVFVMLIWGKGESGNTKTQGNTFARYLNEYDLYNAPKRVLEGENPVQVEKQLSRLQKRVQGVEEQLSVLKRWRSLAQADRHYIGGYKKTAREAAENFKYSAPLAVVAAESVVFDRSPLTEDDLVRLKDYAERVSQSRFDNAELGIRILARELDTPARAAAVSGLENILSRDLSSLPAQVRRNLMIDEFLVRAFKRDIPGASLRLNSILAGTEAAKNEAELFRMAADFFYDHQNPLRSAELFLRCAGERDLAQAADSLVLAGEIPGARNIWLALSAEEGNVPGFSPGMRFRCLYNLASTSANKEEETAWLEKLFSGQSRLHREQDDSTGMYAVIRYARLLDNSGSIALLAETLAAGSGIKHNPLLDLELLRCRQETWPPTRSAAEVWLLLSRNSGNELLYEWAAWYFEHQKLYSENTQLLKDAGRQGMTGPWIELHRSLALIREGKIAEAEKILKEAYRFETGSSYIASSDWRIPANLGRIEESRRAISAALEYYQAAAVLVSNRNEVKGSFPLDAARIQIQLSRCLEALGRTSESRKALEYALELDPDNINIRRELRR